MQEVRQGMQDTENQLRASGEAIRREAQQAQQQGDTLAQEVRAPAPADPPPHMGGLPPADAPVQEGIAPEPMPATPPEAGAPTPQRTERQP